jgi:hypothetical protein
MADRSRALSGSRNFAVLESTAAQIRQHYRADHDVDQALAVPDGWPYPVAGLRLAVRCGYRELEDEGDLEVSLQR